MTNESSAVEASNIIPLSQPKSERYEEMWEKSPTANLYKYRPSGVYFCRASICGHQVRKSLNTTSYTIAQTKLQRFLLEERGRLAVKPDEDLTFEDLVKEWQLRIENDPSKKERSVEYRLTTLGSVRESWKGIDKIMASKFTDDNVFKWACEIRPKFSPTYYNGMVQTLRAVLQVAVDKKILLENPARGRKRNSIKGVPAAPVPVVAPKLPERDQFQKLLEALDRIPARAHAARMIRFLAYSGCRISAARDMKPENIDLANNQIVLPRVKYDIDPVRVPMIPEMRKLAEQLLAEYSGEGPIFQIRDPKKALKKACIEAGINPPISAHKLRHGFVSRCIECGVDVRSIATWCGHRDGGRLILRTYAHTLDKHAQEQAAKVSFGVAQTADVRQD